MGMGALMRSYRWRTREEGAEGSASSTRACHHLRLCIVCIYTVASTAQ
jgi:hypothetical protein